MKADYKDHLSSKSRPGHRDMPEAKRIDRGQPNAEKCSERYDCCGAEFALQFLSRSSSPAPPVRSCLLTCSNHFISIHTCVLTCLHVHVQIHTSRNRPDETRARSSEQVHVQTSAVPDQKGQGVAESGCGKVPTRKAGGAGSMACKTARSKSVLAEEMGRITARHHVEIIAAVHRFQHVV